MPHSETIPSMCARRCVNERNMLATIETRTHSTNEKVRKKRKESTDELSENDGHELKFDEKIQ